MQTSGNRIHPLPTPKSEKVCVLKESKKNLCVTENRLFPYSLIIMLNDYQGFLWFKIIVDNIVNNLETNPKIDMLFHKTKYLL